jgi:hypothetical protein
MHAMWRDGTVFQPTQVQAELAAAEQHGDQVYKLFCP